MNANFEKIVIRAYALNYILVSKALLELLKPKLSKAELEYVERDGPQIYAEYYLLTFYSETGGCPEGRAAAQAAKRLEGQAEQKLTRAGISKERQKLLSNLVYATSKNVSDRHPRDIEDVERHVIGFFNKGILSRYKELAETLDAPKEICEFLSLLLKEVTAIIESENIAA